MNMLLGLILCNLIPAAPNTDLTGVTPNQVQMEDSFWKPRLETNREVTLPHNFRMCEETGRIHNFAVAGGLEEGGFEGIPFNDSDVFKVMEGAAYILGADLTPMPEITVNGENVDVQSIRGYARIQRTWEDGDQVQLRLPFEARVVRAHDLV